MSGGPDSVALLLLATEAWPGRAIAATVDHGLRPEAAAEAAFVASLCSTLGVPHETLRPASPISGSLQAAARAARYAVLEDWRVRQGAGCIMTAHHADDQAETLLMRLNRGSGLSGLAGIRRANGAVLRPLLGWRRVELAAVVAEADITPVADPSNGDARFDRVRIRTALAGADWIDPAALAASASHLAEAEAAIDWAVARLIGERIEACEDALVFDPTDLPAELLRRLVRHAVTAIDPVAQPSGPALDRLLETLGDGGKASMGAALCQGGARWCFTLAPPRRGKN